MLNELPFEPYRMKVVERIHLSTPEERRAAVEAAGFNLYEINSELVLIDLLTDSGTGALSTEQRAAMMQADESYAGNRSIRKLQQTVERLFGFSHFFPTHQGRAAERVLISSLCRPGHMVLGNTHFDTTRANLMAAGVEPVDLPCPQSEDLSRPHPFKGNIDLVALKARLEADASRIPLVILTVTNNSCADQPVSMTNIRETSALVNGYGVPLYLDACRFAQNAWFIQAREPGYQKRSIRSIVQEMFHFADGFFLSAKKDGLSPMGGLIATRSPETADRFRQSILLAEGHPSYGGLAGEHLEAMAMGFYESTEQEYLDHHIAFTDYLGSRLAAAGLPVVQPSGAHAVFLDAKAFVPHLSEAHNPGQSLAVELYVRYGIRGARMRCGNNEFVRLAIPSRVYTQSHLNYVIDSISKLYEQRRTIAPLSLVSTTKILSGFNARYTRPAPMLVATPRAEAELAAEQV